MKKFFFIAALAACSLVSNAQTLRLSTYGGTDLKPYAGEVVNINAYRMIFNGWNTISLPFDMNEEQINETFGADCRLEVLVGAEKVDGAIRLNFQDVKSEGIKANTPYILYYNGKNNNCRISLRGEVSDNKSALTFKVQGSGETITMAGATKETSPKGRYGIMAIDNSEAQFVSVDAKESVFYATRCYVEVSSGNSAILSTNHIQAGEVTGLGSVLANNETADVYNLSGARVASGLNASAINRLQKGVYVVNGKKIQVK